MHTAKLPGICLLFLLLLPGCGSTLLQDFQANEFSEQLYINAKLNFAIKHPLDWQRVTIPVSSLAYQANTVFWKVANPHQKSNTVGTMLIQSTASNCAIDLADLLSNFLATQPELTSGQTKIFSHPAGAALKLLGSDADRGRLTIALQGQQHDFIISLDYPNNKFAELLPIFQDIVASFTEINPAVIQPNSQPK